MLQPGKTGATPRPNLPRIGSVALPCLALVALFLVGCEEYMDVTVSPELVPTIMALYAGTQTAKARSSDLAVTPESPAALSTLAAPAIVGPGSAVVIRLELQSVGRAALEGATLSLPAPDALRFTGASVTAGEVDLDAVGLT
jgi:hypothetical protein